MNLQYTYIKQAPKAPTITAIHGFMGSSTDWEPLIQTLKPFLNILLIDLPGHGNSKMSPHSLSLIADDITNIFKKESIKTSHLLGYSLGGRVCLYLLKNWPDLIKKSFLLSTNFGLTSKTERLKRYHQDQETANKIAQDGFDPFLNAWYSNPMFKTIPLPLKETLIRKRLQNNPKYLAKSLVINSLGLQHDFLQSIKPSKNTLFYGVGELDEKYVALSKKIATVATVTTFKGSHAFHLENPKDVSNWIYRNVL